MDSGEKVKHRVRLKTSLAYGPTAITIVSNLTLFNMERAFAILDLHPALVNSMVWQLWRRLCCRGEKRRLKGLIPEGCSKIQTCWEQRSAKRQRSLLRPS